MTTEAIMTTDTIQASKPAKAQANKKTQTGDTVRREKLLADRLQALELSAFPPARTPFEQEFRDDLGKGRSKDRIQNGSRHLAFVAVLRLRRYRGGNERALMQEAASDWLSGDRLDHQILVNGQIMQPEPPGPHLNDARAVLFRAERLLLRLSMAHAARTDAGDTVVIGRNRAIPRPSHWDKQRGRRKQRRPLQ